jgi:hypothetical protein
MPHDNSTFDAFSLLPFDSEGCERGRYFQMLSEARLDSPSGYSPPQSVLCVFLMTVHCMTYSLERFIKRLRDPAFMFVIAVDDSVKGLDARLQAFWVNESSVFFVHPNIRISWATFSQCFSPWMTVSALVKANIDFSWISLQSGTDILVRSRGIIKKFLHVYHGHSEFFFDHKTSTSTCCVSISKRGRLCFP